MGSKKSGQAKAYGLKSIEKTGYIAQGPQKQVRGHF
jgi:hypothetical protein